MVENRVVGPITPEKSASRLKRVGQRSAHFRGLLVLVAAHAYMLGDCQRLAELHSLRTLRFPNRMKGSSSSSGPIVGDSGTGPKRRPGRLLPASRQRASDLSGRHVAVAPIPDRK